MDGSIELLLGVIAMYFILFANIGIYFLIKNRISKKIKYFFYPGIVFNSLIGVAAEPDYTYLLGMFTFASLMTLFILSENYNKKK